MKPPVSHRASLFTESVIREMTRLCQQHNAVNLAQGFPDFPAPEFLKEAAVRAVRADLNQYAITWGARSLREAVAGKTRRFYGFEVDPEREVTVGCGATECMIAALLAIVNPGDEVVVFEPFYENYGPDAILSGAVPRYVTLHPPDWSFDPEELASAFNNRTRAIIVNTPHNPTGKVFTRQELDQIAALCRKWNVVAVTDEIYEHILYEGEHVFLASLEGMRERTISISGLSKTFCVTGWRLGYAIAPPDLTLAVRKVHDFLTVGAPAPLQEAGAVALASPPEYYRDLAEAYRQRRDLLLEFLDRAGYQSYRPAGSYYILSDFSALGGEDDVAFSRLLVEKGKVAGVPGSSFYSDPHKGRSLIRWCYCKKEETLREAGRRLLAFSRERGVAATG